MKSRNLIITTCLSLGLCLCFGFTAQAQTPVPAIDSQMVKLQKQNLWRPIPLPAIEITQSKQIAQNYAFPSISPDGHQVILFEPGQPGEPNILHLWTDSTHKIQKLLTDREVSGYISWQDDQTCLMRERSTPFKRNGLKRIYSLDQKKNLQLQAKQPLSSARITAYDADDVIILENANNQTLQAISDTRLDRYYAPIVSPDQRYVVFSGLTTGVHLFDIAQNSVVYVGSGGTNPVFSPDGRYLIYAQTTDDGHAFTTGELILIDLDNHSSRVIANPNHEIRLRASLSRLAKKIVYETEKGEIKIGTLVL